MQNIARIATHTPRISARAGAARTLASTSEMRVAVGNASDWSKGSMKEVDAGEGKVLVSRTQDGAFHATSAKCTHYGAPLVKGVLSGNRVTCPWHGACFNVTSGDIEDGPVLDALVKFPVDVEGGKVFVTLPEGAVEERRTPCAHHAQASKDASAAQRAVVVGGGPASAAAVEAMREHGFAGEIVLVSKESLLPYDRIKSSKDMNASGEALQLRSADFYASIGVTTRLGTEVERVDVTEREEGRGVLHFVGGESLPYDKLLLCTGGVPRRFLPSERFTIPGADLGRIMPMRSPQDANAFTGLLKQQGGDVVILGSSFIGMEAAAFLAGNDVEGLSSVTVVGMEKQPLSRVLGEEIGGMIRRLHEEKGVRFFLDATVQEFLPSAEDASVVGSVRLSTGDTIPATAVLVGAGVTPATGMLKGVELARDGSVLVDETLRVKGAEGVWAAGDIARFPSDLAGDDTARIEHWDVAMDQGRVAGANMAGKATPYANVPFFWTVQYGKSIRYCGHAMRYDTTHIVGSLDDLSFCAYLIDSSADKVLAVVTLGADPAAVAAHALMRLNAFPTAAEVKESALDFLPRRLAEVEATADAEGGARNHKFVCASM